LISLKKPKLKMYEDLLDEAIENLEINDRQPIAIEITPNRPSFG
jgi:hypothetical protein